MRRTGSIYPVPWQAAIVITSITKSVYGTQKEQFQLEHVYHDSCLSWDRINTTCSTHRLLIYCVYVSLVMFCLADSNSIILPYFGVAELKENPPAQTIFLLRIVPLCKCLYFSAFIVTFIYHLNWPRKVLMEIF
jgi:hypothetical protein